jgi:hypothetical protein
VRLAWRPQVSRQSAWDLVAHELGLSLAKALELQQIYVAELLHCERQVQAQALQQRQQEQLQQQLQELAQAQQLAAVQAQQQQPTPPAPPARLLAARQLEQEQLVLRQRQQLQGQRSNIVRSMGPPQPPGSFTAQLQQAVATSGQGGSRTDALTDDCLPSIDALLLGSGAGGPTLASAHGMAGHAEQKAAMPQERLQLLLQGAGSHHTGPGAPAGARLNDLYLM